MPLKELFNSLKEKGLFKQYASFEEYQKKDEEPKSEFQQWKEGLSEKEQKDFKFVFGE